MPFSWLNVSVSDAELTAEFNFWKDHFLRTAFVATVCAVVGGFLIAGWPAGTGNPELRNFVKQLWPAFVECAFWFGFLVGLLWAASRRIGCAIAGTAPWNPAEKPPASVFAQAACGLFFGSCLLWLGMQFARRFAGKAEPLLLSLDQLVSAGFTGAVICLLLAVGLRKWAARKS